MEIKTKERKNGWEGRIPGEAGLGMPWMIRGDQGRLWNIRGLFPKQ